MRLEVAEIVEVIVREGMFKVGLFKLTSGLKSPFYIDLRRLYSYPQTARMVANLLLQVVDIEYDALAGVATAGVPLAAYMACLSGKPLGYVRPAKKQHGTGSLVEGNLEGKTVVVVDDVATTGGSLSSAIEALREYGAKPVAATVVVDREQGARKRIEGLGVKFYALLTVSELVDIATKKGLFSDNDARRILEYIRSTSA
jgi:orotate phosphoribosyltransferase